MNDDQNMPLGPHDLGAIIHRVQSRFIRSAEAHEVFDALLPELITLTGSEYGFVGEVWHDDGGAPYLKIFTLTDVAWDDATRELVARERINGLEFRNLDSLLGAAMTTREPVISNAPKLDARSGGLPKGHPGMHSYLGVPLFHGGTMVGQLGLANRRGGYDRALVERLDPLFAAVGAIIGAVQLERQRRRAEDALRDRDALLHKLTQQVPGVIHQLKRSPEGRLTMPYVSLGVRDAYELDPDDVHDDARKMFTRIHPEDAKPMWAATLRSFKTLEPWRATYRVLLPKGGLRWHEAHSAAERLPDGSVLWTGYIVDITERKHYEEVSVAAEAAQRANIAKTEFLSRMSHELRTPLNAVLGFSQLLLAEGAEPLSDAQRAKLKHIETAGGHLLAMINDVLDLSRVESGSMLLSHEVVRVDAVVGEALAMVATLAHQTGVWLRADPPRRASGAPALYVRADHVRLCQVLVNLLSNALKYNRSGGSAVIDWRAAPGERSVLIGVSDTGPGLSDEQRAHLFEPFNRLGAERSKVEGTGIGLVITRRLVELMQGQLSVQSEVGRGSRFELQLPAAEPALAAAVDASGEPPARSVMYAEDNPLNVELVREVLLLRPQYRLLIARSGAEALEVATRELPDLLLIDMHLGDMSGLDLAQLLDQNPTLRHRPRIVLSADAVPERKRQARDAGFAAYLTKPVNVVALLGCLDEHLERSTA